MFASQFREQDSYILRGLEFSEYHEFCPGLYYVNHSCDPNARIVNGAYEYGHSSNTHPKQELMAIRFIPVGEEITVNYLGSLPYVNPNIKERKKLVRDVLGFDCNCPSCKAAN